MNETCMEHLWDIGGIVMGYGRNNDGIRLEFGRNIGGIKLFGWIVMDLHEYVWMDTYGYGGIWIRADGCE